jgi:hypothetical protein
MTDLYFLESANGIRFFPDGKHTKRAVYDHVRRLAENDAADGLARVEGLRIGRVLAKRIEWLDAGTVVGRCRR